MAGLAVDISTIGALAGGDGIGHSYRIELGAGVAMAGFTTHHMNGVEFKRCVHLMTDSTAGYYLAMVMICFGIVPAGMTGLAVDIGSICTLAGIDGISDHSWIELGAAVTMAGATILLMQGVDGCLCGNSVARSARGQDYPMVMVGRGVMTSSMAGLAVDIGAGCALAGGDSIGDHGCIELSAGVAMAGAAILFMQGVDCCLRAHGMAGVTSPCHFAMVMVAFCIVADHMTGLTINFSSVYAFA